MSQHANYISVRNVCANGQRQEGTHIGEPILLEQYNYSYLLFFVSFNVVIKIVGFWLDNRYSFFTKEPHLTIDILSNSS